MIIDGKIIASQIEEEIKSELKIGVPKLSAVVIGSDEGTLSYMRNIQKVGERIGVEVNIHSLPEESKTEEVINLISNLQTDGIIVAKPIPSHIDERKVIASIPPSKDVDCLHPVNLGRLFLNDPLFYPCTPLAVIEILKRTGIEISGKDVVIIGRSDVVGKPLAVMLMQRGVDATVTICHTKTRDLESHTRRADILIVAAGRPEFVKSKMVKKGAVVIDVGINVKNNRLVGDVDFNEVRKVASWITPVPGGVGPVTSRILMKNVIKASKLNRESSRRL